MGITKNGYDTIRTSKRHTKEADAPTITQAQDRQTEISGNGMKYHYRTGIKKSLWERYGRFVKWLIAALIIILILDMAFNYCKLLIEIMVWTWE